ncbi:Rv3654c family TadE-like protein [Corynebacterium sp.]|uniref:Rv3654c family TadE-like protein n=1 Tax=Corynebacterium sp. TaxID=1720 RepID=UPI0026E09F1D|nr:Rv3654c family TadE-like protein [Corynebacterium sp.]MDO5513107.1 pilus assembly protein TadG-related protein [Corynebacterium sp.]
MPTIVTAGAAAALISLCLVVVAAAGQVEARHRAQVAADLAAVAGAFALYRGDHGCAVAEQVAGYNGASISTCDVRGADLRVTARVRGKEVTATAGPV